MIELLRTRRSVRKYETRAIDALTLEILKEALLRCPSSRGKNPWTFIFVDEPGLLHRLAEAKEQGSQFLKDAPLGIVVCADETKSDVWVEDCSIASIVVQLVAQSLGLGSCWIQIRNRSHSSGKEAGKYVQELLGLPGNMKVECIIALGFPAEAKTPVPFGDLNYGTIRYNGYGDKP
jgi:nitroreductase